jgi:hypothetical protein
MGNLSELERNVGKRISGSVVKLELRGILMFWRSFPPQRVCTKHCPDILTQKQHFIEATELEASS